MGRKLYTIGNDCVGYILLMTALFLFYLLFSYQLNIPKAAMHKAAFFFKYFLSYPQIYAQKSRGLALRRKKNLFTKAQKIMHR